MRAAATTGPEAELTPLLTTEEVADLLSVHRATVYRWVRLGLLSPVHLTRRCVRYRAADVRAFIDSAAGLSGERVRP